MTDQVSIQRIRQFLRKSFRENKVIFFELKEMFDMINGKIIQHMLGRDFSADAKDPGKKNAWSDEEENHANEILNSVSKLEVDILKSFDEKYNFDMIVYEMEKADQKKIENFFIEMFEAYQKSDPENKLSILEFVSLMDKSLSEALLDKKEPNEEVEHEVAKVTSLGEARERKNRK